MIIELNGLESFSLGILVFLTGWRMNAKFKFLRDYTIPEPVSGGLLATTLFALSYLLFDLDFSFDLTARDGLILYFFTTIGLNANFRKLIKGGKALVILLVAAVAYLVVQNAVGVGLAGIFGLSKGAGVIAGSISLVGGHGTAIAWAPILTEQYQVPNALEVGTACATFGLVLASIIGGPAANWLIKRHNLTPTETGNLDIGTTPEQYEGSVDHIEILQALLAVQVTIILGLGLDRLLESVGIMMPTFVVCLFTGIIFTNTFPLVFRKWKWPAETLSMGLIAEISLGVFLAMSLMHIELWDIADLAAPLFIILLAQFLVCLAYILLVVFNIMGRDYEAAVMVAGFGGFGLGATPTAIANMTAVTERYGPAHMAFIVLPLVCSFFIDLFNSIIIRLFL